MHGRALHLRLFGLLVAAAGVVLVLLLDVTGLLEQLDDGRIAGGAMQGEETLRRRFPRAETGSARRCGERWCPGVRGSGFGLTGIVSCAHVLLSYRN
ncbi:MULTISPECIES: hypothetical protein [unclassified Kitasatospora]|uniref:hypothetical protein n=1 Tax=unclassified Kitasatospora TaxID=2633591 RepID=UPI00247470F9|nr:hypothetical protein [Kitasatospora sp. MAP12-44]